MINHGPIKAESLFSFIVPENHEPCRVDKYISCLFPDYSRTFFQNIVQAGNVTINQKTIKKPSELVHAHDTISLQFPSQRITDPHDIIDRTSGINIIANTEHFMVIHKPANLLVHAPSNNSNAITVVDWIRHNYTDISSIGPTDRPGIIHRLDRETSGLLIITKTHYAHNVIGALFRERHIHKTYKALVAGHPPREGIITFAIGRNPKNRLMMKSFDENDIDETGKVDKTKVRHAKSDYKVIEYFEDSSLVEVKPTTGRTHQIRVHMAAIGHPIIADQLYGAKSPYMERHALHAEKLEFVFEGKKYSFFDELPQDFQQLLNSARTSAIQKK